MENSTTNYDFPKYEEYIDCMVAFIDILGFSSKVKNIRTEKNFDEVGKLIQALKEEEKSFNNENTLFEKLTITAISDSIIITMPYHAPFCTTLIIRVIQNLQYDFIATRFKTLLRGYLTRGLVYHKDNIIFGKGYMDAYKGETEIGHAPRIVIAPKIVEGVRAKGLSTKKQKNIFDSMTKDPEDNHYFIDYLEPTKLQAGVLTREELIAKREGIKSFIEENLKLYRESENIYPKYEWLKKYILRTEHYLNEGNNV